MGWTLTLSWTPARRRYWGDGKITMPAPRTIYAVDGGEGWTYYAQVTPTRDFGFFRFRSLGIVGHAAALASPIMCRLLIDARSVPRAIQTARWVKVGKEPIHSALLGPRICVQWPSGTSGVIVWQVRAVGGTLQSENRETTIDDPTIQDIEMGASWDAVQHVPDRLKADYGEEAADWHVGGPVWRARRVAVEMARRHPENRFVQHRARMARLSPHH